MIVQIVLYILRGDSELHILDFLIQRNLLHVNPINPFAMHLMVIINDHRDMDMPTMRFPQNSNKFSCKVELFTRHSMTIASQTM